MTLITPPRRALLQAGFAATSLAVVSRAWAGNEKQGEQAEEVTPPEDLMRYARGAMVLTPVSRLGPPPRSFAADAHDCIMVRSLRTYRIQGCGAMLRARWQAPLGPLCCPT
jgi:hypothetical protein